MFNKDGCLTAHLLLSFLLLSFAGFFRTGLYLTTDLDSNFPAHEFEHFSHDLLPTMAPVQTQMMSPHHHHQFQQPVAVIRGSRRISKPTAKSARSSNAHKPLLYDTAQNATAHPDINLTLLRNKLVLTCRRYIPSSLLHEAVADGIYSRAERWITPSSQRASNFGKRKRYYVLHASTFTFQSLGSAWDAKILSGGSRSIDAGNGVVIFVKERREWDAFLRGYRRQGKRAGQLMKLQQKDTERMWREAWKRKCAGDEDGRQGMLVGKLEANAGPMEVLVRSAVARIVRGEA